MKKQFTLSTLAGLALVAAAPVFADDQAGAGVKAEAKIESEQSAKPGLGQRIKGFFGIGQDQGTQTADKTKAQADKVKAKTTSTTDAAVTEIKGQSEAAQEHAAEAKAEGQAKAESAKQEGDNAQGASDSAKDEGSNRQGEGLGIGSEVQADIKLDAKGGKK